MKTTSFIYSKWLLTLALLFWQAISLAQAPAISWQKSLGGSRLDEAYSIQQTIDGGYIVAGTSFSNNGDVSVHVGIQYWIVKLDANGALSWQKCLGGGNFDQAKSIQQTTDGGYIVAGRSGSNGGDVTGNHGYEDYWIVKLDSNGNITWQKSLGGSAEDYAFSVDQTTDGGYIVAGMSYSDDSGDVTGHYQNSDYWIVKLAANGNLSWQKCLGGSSGDGAFSVDQTTDGGYIVAGYSDSNDGDVIGKHGDLDYWIVKLAANGNLSWQKCLGGSGRDVANFIQQTTDGGYIVAGYSSSINGEVTGNHGSYDYWIVKLDTNGNLSWQKCLGGSNVEGANAIQQTTDGGYIVAGSSSSIDGDVTGYHDSTDYWIVKLDANGNPSWQKCLGGSRKDIAYNIQQTTDGGYIVAGESKSNDGDVTGNHGDWDYWVVKLSKDPVGIDEASRIGGLSVWGANPARDVLNIESDVARELVVLNVMGELVIRKSIIGKVEVDVSRLPSGVYWVRDIDSGSGVKFVKE